jgi:NADH:ubiquinone oxidoreductase subunit 5 (subunit L)/multisubunit Na+/H+ antiporter MnhA subunit
MKRNKRKKMKTGTKKWTGLLEAIMVASLVTLMPMVSAQAEAEAGAEGEGINETAFWAFVTIALTVVVLVIITGIFHYLSTRELRKMGTEIAVEMGKMGGKVHEGVSEEAKSYPAHHSGDCEVVKE